MPNGDPAPAGRPTANLRDAVRAGLAASALRSPLVPSAVAVAIIAAVGLWAQVVQIASPQPSGYQAPVSIPPMARTQADFAALRLALEARRAGATDDAQVRDYVRAHDAWGRPFPYPPFVYRALAPLGNVGATAAGRLWIAAFLIAFPCAVGAFLARAHPALRGHRAGLLGLVLLAFASSASALLQLERGNFDWLVGAVYLLALAAIASERRWAGGVLLGIAVALKVYPVLLLVALVAIRRWKEPVAALATLGLVFLLTGPADNLAWLAALRGDRANWLVVNSWNTSLANAIAWAWPNLPTQAVERVALAVFALLFGGLLAVLFVRTRAGVRYRAAQVGAALLPFMFLVPSTTWSYTLFLLLPVLFGLAEGYVAIPRARTAILVATAAIGLAQTPLVAIALRDPYWGRALTPVYSACLVAIALAEVWLLWRGWCAERDEPAHGVTGAAGLPAQNIPS